MVASKKKSSSSPALYQELRQQRLDHRNRASYRQKKIIAEMVAAKKKSPSPTAYEELRQQRLDENKKRMEELNLTKLSQSLKTPSSSPMKRTKPRIIGTQMVALRRSNRVANNPAPVYQEIVTYERLRFNFPRRRGYYKRGDLSGRVYASDEARARATLKAEELEVSLGSDYPTMIKPMLQSHVTGGFWLGLQSYFCRKNLPRSDDTITLVDDDGEEYPTVYLAHKCGLSGGWRGFSIDHELVDGDALVFQLIRPTVFKVYIIRVNELEEDKIQQA